MRIIKLTEPTVNIGTSRPVWINPENITHFFEWTYRQNPPSIPNQPRGEAQIIATTCIIFNAASAEDSISVNVLERPSEVASMIDGDDLPW